MIDLPPELDVPAKCQAQRIFDRFGVTPFGMAKLLGVSPNTTYRWLYERPRGRGGVVPVKAMRKIIAVARVNGVLLRPADFDPRPMPDD